MLSAMPALRLVLGALLLFGCASAPRSVTQPSPTAPPPGDPAASPSGSPSASASPPVSTPGAPCIVARISDGDTLTCEDGTKVRLLLIDCPEMKQGEWGARGKDALSALTPLGSTVRLEVDVQPRDRYGRLLAYVFLPDGRMANEEMARQGFAVALTYPPNVQHVELIRAAVEAAKADKRGLWATSAFECSPRDYRAKRCG